MELREPEQRSELKKHVYAIHCSNSLTLVQRKLFNALLLNSYHDLPSKSKFAIPSTKLCELIGYNSNDHESLKEALRGLTKITIEWNIIEVSSQKKLKEKWQASSILASATLQNGVCTYEYSSVMREHLYRPEIYGRLDMKAVASFTSGYGLALYENCMRFQSLPQTSLFPIDVFRKLMGVPPEKYPLFKDFKKRVIDIAVHEVNKHSPLLILPQLERVKQKVTAISFKLTPKSASPTVSLPENIDLQPNDVSKALSEYFGLSKEVINKIFEAHSPNYIQEKIELVQNSKNFRAGKINTLSGYLLEALKKDYKLPKSSAEVLEQQRRKKEALENAKLLELKTQQQLDKAYDDYHSGVLQNYFNDLPARAQESLLKEFEDCLKLSRPFLTSYYSKSKFESKPVKAYFHEFLLEKRGGEIGKITDKETFARGHNKVNKGKKD